MEPPLHPRQRLLRLLKGIANSTVQRAEIRCQCLHDDDAFELAESLGNSESLLHLDLTACSISIAGIIQVFQNVPSCLESLTLACTSLPPHAVTALATVLPASSSLVALHLDDCRLGNPGLEAMASAFCNTKTTTKDVGWPSLKVLTLSKNLICSSHHACQNFGAGLRRLPHLEFLDLSRNRFESCDLEALQLHHLASLRKISLWDNRLGPLCGLALRDILLHCRSLQELNIRNNALGDVGVVDAFSLLDEDGYREFPLRLLYLSSNLLSDPAAVCMARQLNTSFPHLTALYMTGNDIGSDGAIEFSRTLSHNSAALKTLDLYRNKIGNRGGEALAHMIWNDNTHLLDLNITCNRITNVALLKAVRFAGKLNRSGRYLLQLHETIPSALWPLVLEKMNVLLDVRYYFVSHLPELFIT
ncbi:NLR family [Fragilaria crotonensis]|nr:NLR family [Fragilaria crotonensis]